MRHRWDAVSLDAGIHWCTRCGAVDAELAPVCPAAPVSAEARAVQKSANLAQYGPGKWLIAVDRNPDVRIETVVTRGLNVAPE